jgi:lipopolysaccharide transport system permease protein
MSLLNPKGHFLAFGELIRLLIRHRQLTWEMTRREISDRYAGQVLGTLWSLVHPLLLMGIYVFIFSVVFKMRIGGTRDLPLDYTTYVLAGLIPWMSFQESMSKGTMVIIANGNLVKQVVFPIEILPVTGVIAAFLSQIVSTTVLTIYVLFRHGALPWTFALLPVLFVFQILAMIGVSFLLASVGVYFRDLKDFVQVFCVMGMYLIPAFYLPTMVPAVFRPILYLNPFSYVIWCYQDVCYFGRFEHPWAWAVLVSLSLGVFYVGYRVFRKLKVAFGNIL